MSKARSSKAQPNVSANPELVARREYRAPGALVAAAWADAGQTAQWRGPHGFCGTLSAHS